MAVSPQDEWEDQLLVSESTSSAPSTPDDVPTISARRLNPHGSEAAEARRRRDEAIARAARTSGRTRRLGNPLLLALGAVALAATAWLSVANTPVRDPTPSALLGEWTPVHPDYAGSRLAFSASSVTISPPTGERTTHRIVSLRAIPEAGGVRVELAYATPDGPVHLGATLQTDEAPPRLVFERPVGLVWERVAGDEAP
jgi:hypothetical protein